MDKKRFPDKKSVEDHKYDLSGVDLSGADLSHAKLSGADLRGQDIDDLISSGAIIDKE